MPITVYKNEIVWQFLLNKKRFYSGPLKYAHLLWLQLAPNFRQTAVKPAQNAQDGLIEYGTTAHLGLQLKFLKD
jgi:hypothetical protein